MKLKLNLRMNHSQTFLLLFVVKFVFTSHDSSQTLLPPWLHAMDHQELQFTQVPPQLLYDAVSFLNHICPYQTISFKYSSVTRCCPPNLFLCFLLPGEANAGGCFGRL